MASANMWTSFTPPGSEGYPLIGETPNFLYDMMSFIQNRIIRYGAIFRTHLFGKTTVIATSYEGALDVLENSSTFNANLAYAEFLSIVYPSDNFLLAHDETACRKSAETFLHRALHESLDCYHKPIRKAILRCLDSLITESDTDLGLYEICKPLAQEALLVTLFGLQLSSKEVDMLRTLASDHLNGVVTTAVSLHARRRARRAHDALMTFVRSRLVDQANGSEIKCVLDVAKMMVQCGELDIVIAANSLVVLTSAVVGKALASAASSTLDFLIKRRKTWLAARKAYEEHIHRRNVADFLDEAILESLRLMPPLAGAIRLSNDLETPDSNSSLPDGFRMWGSIIHANRDPNIYQAANEFRPSRWTTCSTGKERVFKGGCPFAWPGEEGDTTGSRSPLSFGSGARRCKGRELAWLVVREMIGSMVSRLDLCDSVNDDAPRGSTDGLEAASLDSIRVFPVVRAAENRRFGVGPRQG